MFNEYGYKENSGFISKVKQINNHIDSFREANKQAINENTEAIIAQTEQQKLDAEALRNVITAQTEQQKLDAEALRIVVSAQTEQQKNDALAIRELTKEEGDKSRTTFSGTIITVFSNLVGTVKGIFGKKGEYHDMVEREYNETQAFISAHTATYKEENDESQVLINDKLNSIISELKSINGSIEENTSGDAFNSNEIKDAISKLERAVYNNKN